MKELSDEATAKLLRQLFDTNRSEWTSNDLFVPPTYLQKLESARPSILIGGRGTGKTTSLQSLQYDVTHSRLEATGRDFGDQEYLGIFVRINKNRVRAFQGESLPDSEWRKVFAHYFNLLSCIELVSLGVWLEEKNGLSMPVESVNLISSDLGLEERNSLLELKTLMKKAISQLQLVVNNPSKIQSISYSISEAPLRTIVESLEESKLLGDRVVFCCIDEYENLLDYQQEVLNTYIKHSEPPLSYKIGVRKNGYRIKDTLDKNDPLNTPDDFAEIEIADEGFEYFAKEVAEVRLKFAHQEGVNIPVSLKELLTELTFSQEAELLGATKVSESILDELKYLDESLYNFFLDKPASEIYFLRYWQETEKNSLLELAKDWERNQTAWATRIGNYGYASLFWLSKGNKGKRIKKYYCGSGVFLKLSAGNIRYFLELINTAIGNEIGVYQRPDMLNLSPESQTLAARSVGLRRLNQLEGLADHGVQLKRLLLAIGKVLWEYARNPVGRAPEVTNFVITGDSESKRRVEGLIKEGVGYLAFEAETRTKATSNTELRDDEYRLHRIFCGFFEVSYRKKRRVNFDADTLIEALGEKPSKAITKLLNGHAQSAIEDLPDQLALFDEFYDGDNVEK